MNPITHPRHGLLILFFLFSIPLGLKAQPCKAVSIAGERLWHHLLIDKKQGTKSGIQRWRTEMKRKFPKGAPTLLGKEASKGKVWGQTQRIYLSKPFPQTEGNVYFRTFSGKGKVALSICLMDQSGKLVHQKTVVVNQETGSEGIRVGLRQAKGKLVLIQLKNYSSQGTIEYALKVS